MNRREVMRKMWPIWGEMDIRLLVVALPPTHDGKGNVYMPDCFTSKTMDGKFSTNNSDFQIITCKINEVYGPVVLAECKLKDLLRFNENGFLQAQSDAVCAEVAAYNLLEDGGLVYADKVTINHFSFGGSCHPSSHYIVPEAPHLTSLLQYHKAPKLPNYVGKGISDWDIQSLDSLNKKMVVDFMSPTDGELVFSNYSWGLNSLVDLFISKCACEPSVSFFGTLGGLQRWASEPLKTMRRNALTKGDLLYEHISPGQILRPASQTVIQGQANSESTGIDQSNGNKEIEGVKAAS